MKQYPFWKSRFKMSECSKKRPISQLVLITYIFNYKTVQFGEFRPIIHSFIDDLYRLYHTRKTANFQALMPLV